MWSESVAQLMATKGPEARGPRVWRARAISSLPVPLSPMMSTVESWGAARFSASNSCCIAFDSPTIPSVCISAAATVGGVDKAPLAPARPMHRSRVERRVSTWIGLVRKSAAPRFIASTAESMVPKPVTTIAGKPGASASTDSSTDSPSMSGSFRSRMSA